MLNKLINILIITGIILVAIFNPFSIVLFADALVVVINQLKEVLVEVSLYAVVVGSTLLAVGGIFKYIGYKEVQKKKLKKMGSKAKAAKSPTQKYLETA